MTVRTTVVPRLACRNLRHRPVTSLLLVLPLAAASGTLALALSVGEAAEAPWDRTFARTVGPHVAVEARDADALSAVARSREVASVGGPWPLVITSGRVAGHELPFRFVGRDAFDGPVERPVLTAGTADLDDGVVLERSLAGSLGIRVGDTVVAAGLRLPVRGIAVSVAQAPFPATVPGLAWVSTRTARQLAPTADPQALQLHLRLTSAHAAGAFVARHQGHTSGAAFSTWQEIRATTLEEVRTTRVVLLTVSALLALLTTASVAVVVAMSMSRRVRQIGVLKAVGLTPRQVTGVVVLEHLVLATVGTALGLAAGTILAPAVARSGTSLLGSADAPVPGLADILLVAGVTALVIATATVRPAWQAARYSTVRSLADGARPPRQAPRLAVLALLLRLPLSFSIGLRSLGRRPGRTALATGTVTLSVTMLVAALAMERTLQLDASTRDATTDGMPGPGPIDPSLLVGLDAAADERLRTLVYLFTALSLLLGLLNVSVVAAYLAQDQARNHAAMRAIGFTQRQTVTGLAVGQGFGAALGALLGVPLGILVFRLSYTAANGSSDGAAGPPAAWLLPLPLIAAVVATALAAIPARALAGRRPGEVLAHE